MTTVGRHAPPASEERTTAAARGASAQRRPSGPARGGVLSDSQQGYGTRPEAARTGLLTPESTAITACTLAVLSLTGQGVWTQLAQVFFGSSFAANQYVTVLASVALAFSALTLVVGLVNRR